MTGITTDCSGIYKIINKVTGKYYIGSAVNVKKRWDMHRWQLNNRIHYNSYLQRAWDKYSPGSFSFEVIELVDDKNVLISREQFHLDNLTPYLRDCGYNICKVAGSTMGRRMSRETRARLSAERKGTGTGKDNPFFGKKHSTDALTKMRGKQKPSIQGEKHHNSSINEATARTIKTMLKDNIPMRSISRELDVSYGIVNNIKRGRTWKYVS